MKTTNRKPELERELVAVSWCMTNPRASLVLGRDSLRRTRNQLMVQLRDAGYHGRDLAELTGLRRETVYRILNRRAP